MPILTKSNARTVETSRAHLRAGNAQAYARVMSGAIRSAGNLNQVRALWQAIDADDAGHLFDCTNLLCPVALPEQVAA